MGIRKAQVVGYSTTPDGYRITVDSNGTRGVIDVDEDGEGPACIPWDNELEATYALKPKTKVEQSEDWMDKAAQAQAFVERVSQQISKKHKAPEPTEDQARREAEHNGRRS